jgi:hypothetical protein
MFKVIVWHNDSVNGTHQATVASGRTAERALADFASYLTRPAWMRSFTDKNRVQLHGPSGLICDIPAI